MRNGSNLSDGSNESSEAIGSTGAEQADSVRPTEAMPPLFRDDRDYPGHVVAGYIIEGEIGRGGMGTVYAATHPFTRHRAAIKVVSVAAMIDPQAMDRFDCEVRTATALAHPNVVHVLESGRLPDGRPYLVMERLAGESLRARLRDRSLDVATALQVLLQCVAALRAAHEIGIIHRDLKPENVFLTKEASGICVKLLDFGVSKSIEDTKELTETGAMIGTVGYISPEQIRARIVDHRTDIYALGVLGFEMFLGRAPYQRDNAIDLMIAHVEAPVPVLDAVTGVPDSLALAIQQMMAKTAEARPSLDDVARLLARLVEQDELEDLIEDEESVTVRAKPSPPPIPLGASRAPPDPPPVASAPTFSRSVRVHSSAAILTEVVATLPSNHARAGTHGWKLALVALGLTLVIAALIAFAP